MNSLTFPIERRGPQHLTLNLGGFWDCFHMVEVTLGHFQSKQKTDNLYFLSQRTFSTGALELDVRFMSTLTTFGWRDHRELFQVIVSTELSLQPSSPKGQTHAQVILDSPKQPSYPLNITEWPQSMLHGTETHPAEFLSNSWPQYHEV